MSRIRVPAEYLGIFFLPFKIIFMWEKSTEILSVKKMYFLWTLALCK